ncbi:acyltransferase family protein [Aureimonas sp. AU40]|uniref:acyltransferase family protein n=1 Tax=Aureimonas sp. AU40 TaxID=1637747 RepID=UPI000A9E1D07|nr:acyltransferase [Aureimonas sp. AU40]
MHQSKPDAAGQSVLPTSQDPRFRNRNLQWMRAIAALFVLLYHASVYLDQITGESAFLRVFDGRFGLIGVAIFFAISGYLMAEILPKVDPWRFLLHRVVRIYPIFLIVLLSLLLVRRRLDEVDLWAVTLVPVGEGRIYYLGVEWTLLFETTFYVFLFICSLLGLRHRLHWIAGLWLVVITVGTFAYSSVQSVLTPRIELLPIMSVNAAFAAGLLIPRLRASGLFQPALATLAVGILLLSGVFSFGVDRLVASAAAILLVGLVVSNRLHGAGRPGVVSRIADRYGDWSYALYLCHAPLVVAIYLKHPPLPGWGLWCLAVLVPLLVAIPYGIIDLALYRFLKAWVDRSSKTTAALLASLYTAFFVAVAATASLFSTGPTPQLNRQPIAKPVPPPAETAVPTLVPDPVAPQTLAPSPSVP